MSEIPIKLPVRRNAHWIEDANGCEIFFCDTSYTLDEDIAILEFTAAAINSHAADAEKIAALKQQVEAMREFLKQCLIHLESEQLDACLRGRISAALSASALLGRGKTEGGAK